MNKLLPVILLLLFISCSDKNDNLADRSLEQEIANAKLTDFNDLYFVGIYNGLPSIYRYDNKTGKSKIFWSGSNERVIDLLVSEDRQTAFFLTKRKQRLKSSQPAIERGQLYRIDLNTKKVQLIAHLEEGIQMIAFWTDNDRFTLVINSIDKTVASYINKNTQVYNRFGKLLSDNNEIFDLTKDGYPITKLPPLKYTSPNKMFNIIERNDSVFVQQKNNKELLKTKISAKVIKQIGWADNNKQLILLYMDDLDHQELKKEKVSSTLIIYDLKLKKAVESFKGVGYKRFVLIGDLLIFDNGFGRDSYIEMFSLSSLKENQKIKIPGGCALNNILGL